MSDAVQAGSQQNQRGLKLKLSIQSDEQNRQKEQPTNRQMGIKRD